MIRKTVNLLKKDIMLIGNYSILAVLILLVFPIFLNYSIGGIMEPSYFLFLSVDFCAFVVFGQIYLMESKYKGMTYLMACPFKRVHMIIARYLLLLLICGLGILFYKALEWMNLGNLFPVNAKINVPQIVLAVSIVVIAYNVLLPILNNFVYEKVRILHAALTIIVPIWGVLLVKYLLQYFQVSLQMHEMSHNGAVILVICDIILTIISVMINIKLWEKKEF